MADETLHGSNAPPQRSGDLAVARLRAMLDALGYGAQRIVGGEDWRAEIGELLARLGVASEVSRVTLFEVHPGPDGSPVESCRFDWAEPGLATLSGNPRYHNMPISDHADPAVLDDWAMRRRRGEVVAARRSETTGYTREVFEEHGTLSFISVPIHIEGEWYGFLGFDDCKQEREWGELEVDLLRAAAALVAGAVRRSRIQERLRASQRLLREVVDAVPAVINVKDLQSRYLLMNRFQGELYGVRPQDAIGHTSSEFVGETYGGQSRDLDRTVIETGQPLPFSERDFIDVAGRAHTWYTAKLPLFDQLGALEGVVTVALDISELKATERARAHLARYVTPAVAESLASTSEPFGPPREQDAAVLFTDIVNSSRLFIEWPPQKVFTLLRDVHAIMARTIFEHSGTLDKFIGDGVMATFGTPFAGPCDASNALACARMLRGAIAKWNGERARAGERPVRIAIGLHFGPVLMGNMGDEQRMEFAVIGDTVNIASRLERLARPLNAAIVLSDSVVAAIECETGPDGMDSGELLSGLIKCEPQPIAGRDEPVGVSILPYEE